MSALDLSREEVEEAGDGHGRDPQHPEHPGGSGRRAEQKAARRAFWRQGQLHGYESEPAERYIRNAGEHYGDHLYPEARSEVPEEVMSAVIHGSGTLRPAG